MTFDEWFAANVCRMSNSLHSRQLHISPVWGRVAPAGWGMVSRVRAPSIVLLKSHRVIMSIRAILLPLFVEVALTFGLLLWLAMLRRNDLISGAVRPAQIALRERHWTQRTQQVGHAFSNQFEVPVLFYLLTVLEIVTRQADLLFVVLAWIFVLTRLAHATVHTTSNRVRLRGAIYGVGVFVLIVMWTAFIARIVLDLP